MAFVTPAEFIRNKKLLTGISTWEAWERVPPQTREDCFFMMGVDDTSILKAFQETAADIAGGGKSHAEGREYLRRFLDDYGYRSSTPGTIEDIASSERMELELELWEGLAWGKAQRCQQLDSLVHPGQRLFRKCQARVPCDWATRWRNAAQAVRWEGVARGGEMVALITSPIWVKLSRFGHPYPPFDFNSGMWVMPVGIDECMELGLLCP